MLRIVASKVCIVVPSAAFAAAAAAERSRRRLTELMLPMQMHLGLRLIVLLVLLLVRLLLLLQMLPVLRIRVVVLTRAACALVTASGFALSLRELRVWALPILWLLQLLLLVEAGVVIRDRRRNTQCRLWVKPMNRTGKNFFKAGS